MLTARAKWELRRAFLRSRSFPAFALGTLIDRLPRRRGPAQKVLVVGAGLAGLSAAYRLSKLGHEVTVLEASKRVGGRALTLHEPFTGGLHADAGGFRFRDDHHLVKSYVKRFGLSFCHFCPSEGQFVAYIEGAMFSRTRWEGIQSKPLPRKLTPLEQWCFDQEHDFQTYKLDAGANVLPDAFAERLGRRIRLDCAVSSIAHDSESVRVACVNAGQPEELSADRVICAVPFSSLRRISISPQVSTQKQRVICELPYAGPSLVYLQVRTGFLKKLGLNGFAVTDTVGEVWHLTFHRQAPVGILLSYTRGDLGNYFASLEESERIRTTIERMEKIFPGIGSQVELTATKCWGEDQWTVGAQSMTQALSPSDLAVIRQSEGRLHFAGEHAALRQPGWMEGAIESGHRVARDIDQCLK